MSFADEATTLAISTLSAVVAFWGIELVVTRGLESPVHALASFGLFVAAGAACSIAVICLVWLPLRAIASAAFFRTRAARTLACAAFTSLLALVALRYALEVTLANRGASLTLTLTLSGSAVLLGAFVALAMRAAMQLQPPRLGTQTLTFAWTSLSLLLIALDQNVLVSLYERAHTLTEALALLLFSLGLARALRAPLARSARAQSIARFVVLAAAAWLTTLLSFWTARHVVERSLPSVWEDPGYTARWLRRGRGLVATLRAEGAHANGSAVQRLIEQFEIHDAVVDDTWHAPLQPLESPPGPPHNIVLFFVDALRADVARDPQTMPSLARWLESNVWFTRAYSAGSSTLLGLPAMLGCRYDQSTREPLVLLEAIKAAGLRSRAYLPEAAANYHHAYFPAFRLDEHETVPDGGERTPTAHVMVDDALRWLREERPDRFALLLYHFDVHRWQTLDEAALAHPNVRAAGFAGDLPWRYRASARGVDDAFARLRDGLSELGLDHRTVLVVTSDHGEALGRQSFWNHSTYLWESLVHVPFGIEAPLQTPRVVDEPVSTVSLAPTLRRFVGGLPAAAECHGDDLLSEGERRPVLLSSVAEGGLARVGVLEGSDKKLVVDLRQGIARLLQLPDEIDVTATEPRSLASALSTLVRSPIFPRER